MAYMVILTQLTAYEVSGIAPRSLVRVKHHLHQITKRNRGN